MTSILRRIPVYLLFIGAIVELIGVYLGDVGVAKIASTIGKSGFYMVLGILIYTLYRGDKGVFLIGGLGLTASTDVMLKTTFKMPRPPTAEWLVKAEGPGFPSGHAAMSFSFALLIGYLSGDPLLGIALFIHALAVSGSRLVLHVHYPIDVVGGAIIGVVIAIISIMIYRRVKDAVKYLLIASIPGLVLSVIASLEMPNYTDSPLLTGICLGSLASAIILLRIPNEPLTNNNWRIRVASLIISFIGLVVALKLEASGEYPLVLVGGLVFALLALLSRPITSGMFRGSVGRNTR